jgi:D-glycero-D-manno-heptose 1,7-bisphosphate phosphatase
VLQNFAVFVDRDGTINVDVDFLSSPHQLALIPGSGEAIRSLNELFIPVIVITNQSGIARGIFSEADLAEIHHALDGILDKFGAHVDAYYYCPHHPTDGSDPYVKVCDCRKPMSGMAIQAQQKFNLDLQKSYVVGDKAVDILFGKHIGATSVQVATGYGEKEKSSTEAIRDFYASNLFEAVNFIKRNLSERNTH